MELMGLEFLNDNTIASGELIENYESLIWTERYSQFGDFQLVSSDINNTIKALPLESYVTLRESTVPMIVETHKIEKKKNEAPKITVTGRTFEACALERRGANNTNVKTQSTRGVWMMPAAKESDAAYKAVREVIGDPFARYKGVSLVLNPQNPYISEDALSIVDMTLPADYVDQSTYSVWNSGTTYAVGSLVSHSDGKYYIALANAATNLNKAPNTNPTFWAWLAYEIKPQNLYQTVIELITANNRGIKSVRPGPGGNRIAIEIYNGANLTDYVLDVRFDQVEDATYLLSYQGSTNVAYVYGATGSDAVLKNGALAWSATTIYSTDKVVSYTDGKFYIALANAITNLNKIPPSNPAFWKEISSPAPTEMDRRVLMVGADSQDSTLNTADARNSRGLVELYNNNVIALFGGEVADQVAKDYNKKYFLGDIIKLQGDYGLYQNVRVAEFIRSSDAQGEKAYPTFEAVT